MADIDVSVIIPAYNASQYIGRAVESVKKQTGLTWKIIIVENGSTDDTYDKCLEYANADDRIKVMQSNKGVSNARNKGLDNASGKWICFLDADDYLYDGAFQYISGISQAYETKCVFFGHNSGESKVDRETLTYKDEDKYLDFRCSMLKNPTQYMTVWGKLLDREVINNNNIRFDTNLVLAEDSDFLFRYMQCVDSAVEIRTELYHYSRDNESTVRSYNAATTRNYVKSINNTLKYVKNDGEEIRKAYNQYILIHLILILVHDTYNVNNPATGKQKKHNMKKLLKTDCFRQAIAETKLSECRGFRMLPVICFKLHMDWAAVLMVKVRIYQNSKH